MGRALTVGIDLVEVDRFTRALRRWPRLLERVFTDGEIDSCASSPKLEERLAARFAAKEAAFKALGDGWPRLGYHDVEIRVADGGAPSLVLGGRAATLAGRRAVACSIAHDAGLAIAEVVLQATEEG